MALREIFYGDESGIHAGARYCLVAGYRGSPGQWKSFNRRWRNVLSRPEYNIRGSFHSNVYFHRHRNRNSKENPYTGWSDQKARAFIDELLAVIRAHRIWPTGAAVNVRDFESLSFGERSVLVGYEPTPARRKHRIVPAPYHLACRVMMEDAIRLTDPDTEVHFTLGIQKELQQRALDGFNLTKGLGLEGHAHQLKGIGFESPEDFPGIQAADLYAYQWYQALTHGLRLSAENRRVMHQLTLKRNNMPNINGRGMDEMFHNVGITEANRDELRAVKAPS